MDVYVNLNRAELYLLIDALSCLKIELGDLEQIDNLLCKLAEYVYFFDVSSTAECFPF